MAWDDKSHDTCHISLFFPPSGMYFDPLPPPPCPSDVDDAKKAMTKTPRPPTLLVYLYLERIVIY